MHSPNSIDNEAAAVHHSTANIVIHSNSRRGSTGNHHIHQVSSNLLSIGSTTPASSNRRKSSALNYQTQMQMVNISGSREEIFEQNKCRETGRYSPHPNEVLLSHHCKLSIQPNERFDDALGCCLPPPSPAPNNDRFIVPISTSTGSTGLTDSININDTTCVGNVQSHISFTNGNYELNKAQVPNLLNTQQHHSLSSSTSKSPLSTNSGCSSSSSTTLVTSNIAHVQKFTPNSVPAGGSMLRSLSPAAARVRASERFREQSTAKSQIETSSGSGTARFVSTTQYFSQTAPIIQHDTYNFHLASTVHTPIKRYIPTPPLQNEYLTSSLSSAANNKCAEVNIPNALNSGGLTPQQNVSSVPYRLRIKCCTNELSLQQQQHQQSILPASNNIPHYTTDNHATSAQTDYCTSPRNRSSYKLSNSATPCNNFELPQVILYDQQTQMHISNDVKSTSTYSYMTPPPPIHAQLEQNSFENVNENSIRRGSNCFLGEQHVCQVPSGIECMSSTANSIANSNANISTTQETNSLTVTNNVSNDTAATCMHCNTVRRTTGVHQTTQTGPISPIPVPAPVLISNPNRQAVNNAVVYEQNAPTLLVNSKNETNITATHNINLIQEKVEHQNQHQYSQSNHVSISNEFSKASSSQAKLSSHQLLSNVSRQTQQQQQQQQRYSRKKRLNQYMRKEIAKFFGVEITTEAEERILWQGRQRRLALRRFGTLKNDSELNTAINQNSNNTATSNNGINGCNNCQTSGRPDVLPQDKDIYGENTRFNGRQHSQFYFNADFRFTEYVERKPTVVTMIVTTLIYLVTYFSKKHKRNIQQWSRSFAPKYILGNSDSPVEIFDATTTIQDDEVFFDSPTTNEQNGLGLNNNNNNNSNCIQAQMIISSSNGSSMSPISGNSASVARNINNGCSSSGIKTVENQQRQSYMSERINGWRTTATIVGMDHQAQIVNQNSQASQSSQSHQQSNFRSNRISAHLLDGVLENSRRPVSRRRVKLFTVNDLDDRTDYRPFFTYWINTVQILVLVLSIICYGIGPIGLGMEQKTGQVLVTSLSLQTVQHIEQRNIWIGPRNNDLVHMGAKFAACMRRDVKIINVLLRTRRKERETACCIRNDDSGCVQSSQADCSVRGLFPTKSISTWKKWSPGESGPGGRISGSVCGLDPKYCDAPASIAPYEWPDDITKWPICRKTTFSQRFRYKDHTAEHMVCEVIGHPCCTGIFGECRITTREYCDFVHGYFHEEASLCSQISCLQNVCGMFPFFSIELPDQLYRLFTSLCLHSGILHLLITVTFQHIFLADLERLIGSIRTGLLYIGSGLAGNLTTAVLVPYKAEVGPLASLCGVAASLLVFLVLIHWTQLRKPHIALFKLISIGAMLFGLGTLPWQLNFAGLIAGIVCGIFLTIASVPFVSVTKYDRKSKVNFIWSCFTVHLLFYAAMLATFFLFPMELTNLSFGEVFINNLDENMSNNNIAYTDVLSSKSSYGGDNFNNYKNFPHFLHHHSGDIILNSEITGSTSNKRGHLLQSKMEQHQKQPTLFFYRTYHTNRNSISNSSAINYEHFNFDSNNRQMLANKLNNTKNYEDLISIIKSTKPKAVYKDVNAFKMNNNHTSAHIQHHILQ